MNANLLIVLGIVALIAFVLFAIFMPALLLALIFALAAFGSLLAFRGHPYGIWLFLALLVIAALFGFVQVGQQASLALAGKL